MDPRPKSFEKSRKAKQLPPPPGLHLNHTYCCNENFSYCNPGDPSLGDFRHG